MSIVSFEFLALVAVLLVVHYCLPVRWRWMAMLAASMAFYAWAGIPGLIYLGSVSLVTWLAGLYMGRSYAREKAAKEADNKPEGWNQELRRRRWKILTIVLVVGAMAVVKYNDLIHPVVNALYQWITRSDTPLTAMNIFVPLGLSYFTFQSVGYVIDCARGKTQPEKNPLKYLLFVSFFPQITQGPITTYKQLMPQLKEPARFNSEAFISGFQLFMWGYLKKLVVADRLVSVTEDIIWGTGHRGWVIVLGMILYFIRLYCDFSGGMDVIRGVAKMLGVDMAENFCRPFFATSVAEYWRRWHISLGGWFRSYIFYPLTTSRFGLWLSKVGQKVMGKKVGRMLPGMVATFVIFFLIGIWHVANWNAVIYGAYFGVLLSIGMALEPTFKKWRTKCHINPKAWWWKGFGMVRTWFLLLIPEYFAVNFKVSSSLQLIADTFRNWDFTNVGAIFTGLMDPMEWYILAAAVGLIFLIDVLDECGLDINGRLSRSFFLVRWIVLYALIMGVLIFGYYGAEFNAASFLYTQF